VAGVVVEGEEKEEVEEWGEIVCRMRNLEDESVKDWRADRNSGRRRCMEVRSVMSRAAIIPALSWRFHRLRTRDIRDYARHCASDKPLLERVYFVLRTYTHTLKLWVGADSAILLLRDIVSQA